MDGVYLDWNATTPPCEDALEAMAEASRRAWGNPQSVHDEGRRARAVVEDARAVVARLLGFDPREVIFTSGGTEANNLGLGSARAMVASRVEHPSVVRVVERRESEGAPVRWVTAAASGRPDPDAVEGALAELGEGATVALMAVNHETGVVMPVGAVSEIARRRGARLHVDAVQAAGKLGPESWAGADSVALAAHKIRGPKGIGALAWRSGGVPRPVLVGGAQERGLRPGTVSAPLAAGFAAAARRALEGPVRYAKLAPLRDRLERRLVELGGLVNGEAPRAPHVTNTSFAGWLGDELVAALDLLGVRVSSGSACSAGTSEPSPVVREMHGVERAQAAVRTSLGEETTESEVDQALRAFARVLRRSGPRDLK